MISVPVFGAQRRVLTRLSISAYPTILEVLITPCGVAGIHHRLSPIWHCRRQLVLAIVEDWLVSHYRYINHPHPPYSLSFIYSRLVHLSSHSCWTLSDIMNLETSSRSVNDKLNSVSDLLYRTVISVSLQFIPLKPEYVNILSLRWSRYNKKYMLCYIWIYC